VAGPQLGHDEGDQGDRGGGERGDGQGVGPPGVAGADQAVGDGRRGHREREGAGHVEPAGPRRLRLGHAAHREHDRGQADRQVDQEDPAPAEVLGEHAADERAGGRRGAVDRAPDAERHAPVAALIGHVEQGHRGGEHGRTAGALQHPGRDQRLLVRGDRAQQRGGGEQDGSGDVGAAAAVPVGERTGAEQQGGQGEGVAVEHPLQVGVAGAEPVGDGRQGDHDDGDVHEQQEGTEADRDQRGPFTHAPKNGSAGPSAPLNARVLADLDSG
jgi:hypothetical protein